MGNEVYHWRTKQIISLHNLSKTERKLVDVLSSIWDDPCFLMLATQCLETDEQRQKLLDIIEKENLTDTDEITEIAWDIEDGYI